MTDPLSLTLDQSTEIRRRTIQFRAAKLLGNSIELIIYDCDQLAGANRRTRKFIKLRLSTSDALSIMSIILTSLTGAPAQCPSTNSQSKRPSSRNAPTQWKRTRTPRPKRNVSPGTPTKRSPSETPR